MFSFKHWKPVKAYFEHKDRMIVREREDIAYLKRVCEVNDHDTIPVAFGKIVSVLKRLRGEKE